MGLSEDYITKAAQIKTKSIDNEGKRICISRHRGRSLQRPLSTRLMQRQDSLASKANMVKEFNERNSRK